MKVCCNTHGKGHRKLNLTGFIFTKWTVLYNTETKNSCGSYLWMCKCECGNMSKVSAASLVSGKSKCCGCIGNQKLIERNTGKPSNNRKAYGYSSVRRIYKYYIQNATKRKLQFSIPIDIFIKLTSMDCFYCGVEPKQCYNFLKQNHFGEYYYNGLDRVDNNKGYTIDNVVPCCGKCNHAKAGLSKDEFLELVKNIYLNTIKR